MKLKKSFLIISAGLLSSLVGYLSLRPDPEAQRFRELLKKQKKLSGTDLETAWQAEPPSHLLVQEIPYENIWFVGKYEDGGGVEIPFKTGRFTKKSQDSGPHHENPGFVGPEKCGECHQDTFQSFVEPGHYKTGRPVTHSTIDGKFEPGSNRFQTSDPNVAFEMIRRGEDYLQRVHFFDWDFEVPMDIIFGSSKMAQTYLYWHEDRLYQHNVTHLTQGDQWINSPGFIDGDAAYARPIPQRCMECHMTYFDFRGGINRYSPDSLIMGVTCERCHGPGKAHADYHQQNPDAKDAFSITHPAKLTREREIEICGQCHSGTRDLKKDALTYRPGDRLGDHYHEPDADSDGKNSVHTSNQYNRLSKSSCFKQTEMTCVTCHDPHHNERGNARLFSKRCITCHTREEDCGLFPKDDVKFADNCIGCHMPLRETAGLKLDSIEGDVFPPLRDHLIRIDQEATDEYLSK